MHVYGQIRSEQEKNTTCEVWLNISAWCYHSKGGCSHT